MLFATAVDQFASGLAQPLHGKGWAGAIAQESLKSYTVVSLNAHPDIHREATVRIPQHLLGLKALQQAPAHKGAQDAAAQGGLNLCNGIDIDAACWEEDHVALHFLKHSIDHANVEVNMLI